ncbi:MAG: DUF1614 domain-containing protein [Thermoplasmatota archaeon]
MAAATGIPLAVALIVGLLVFLLLYLAIAAFRGAGFTIVETLALLLLAPLTRGLDVPIYQRGNLVLGLNFAGAIIPVFICVRMLLQHRAPFWRTAVATAIVAYVVNRESTFIPDQGVALDIVVPVLVAAIVGLLFAAGRVDRSPLITYVAGSMGVLIGGDLVRLPQVLALHPAREELLAIGGAGTLDGIFVVALAAVALEMILFGIFGRRER